MKLKPNETIVLKSVGRNYNNFKYPKRGWVEAPDWIAHSKCGNGLHGNEWGKAGHNLTQHGDKFAVIKVNKDDGFVELGDKCKFRKGYVVATFNKLIEAYNYIRPFIPKDVYFNFDMQVGGDESTQKAGEESIQSVGIDSTQTAGSFSTQTAGKYSTQTAEDNATQTAGSFSTQTAGKYSTQTAGSFSTQTAGSFSTQTAGKYSTQTAGKDSTHIIYGNTCMLKLSKSSILIMHTPKEVLVFTDEDLPINKWVSIEIED